MDKEKKLSDNRLLIVILGPTASGKTAASIELSKFFDIEIISADSRQIYKFLDIGTSKPTAEELAKVKHHFIDFLYPDENYSSGKFGDEAESVADSIIKKGKLPVVVGGSGLYIKSLCEGLFAEEKDDNFYKIRSELNNRLIADGIDFLYEELLKVDPISAKKYNDKNPRRIIRALEYYHATGIPFSEAHSEKVKERNFDVLYFGISYERQKLYGRINERTEIIWKSGLIEETQKVLSLGYSTILNSLNTVGYKESIAFINNKMKEVEAIEEIKKNTRHYAKRQMTWFSKNPEIKWLQGCEPATIAKQIYKEVKKKMGR